MKTTLDEAKHIASLWWDGQNDPLYKFGSTGRLDDVTDYADCLSGIAEIQKTAIARADYDQLTDLATYLVQELGQEFTLEKILVVWDLESMYDDCCGEVENRGYYASFSFAEKDWAIYPATRLLAGAILHYDSQGFKHVAEFLSAEAFAAVWDEIKLEYDVREDAEVYNED